nr:methyltransferase domain-containing protein [Cytophagales bacterium]
MSKLYVQYGAGNEAIDGWLNFDASPTLRMQKIPILGRLLRPYLNCVFDTDVKFGDIVSGLPLKPESVDFLFSSHVLEHLSHTDFCSALKHSYTYLKSGGVFRVIVPDLAYYIAEYERAKRSGDTNRVAIAAYNFCKNTGFGIEESRNSVFGRLKQAFSGSDHCWMWDYESLYQALLDHGFVNIMRFTQGASKNEMLLRPERDHQFGDKFGQYGLALECSKPTKP